MALPLGVGSSPCAAPPPSDSLLVKTGLQLQRQSPGALSATFAQKELQSQLRAFQKSCVNSLAFCSLFLTIFLRTIDSVFFFHKPLFVFLIELQPHRPSLSAWDKTPRTGMDSFSPTGDRASPSVAVAVDKSADSLSRRSA